MAQTLTQPITINLPDSIVKELELAAHQQQRSISEVVQALILQRYDALPRLPDDVEAELAAIASLSDEALWLLARGTLSLAEQQEIDNLNSLAKQRPLTAEEEARREELLHLYDRTMVRRAEAAFHLQSRGYDLSDPAVLQSE